MASGEAICSEILTVLTSRRSYVWASRSAAVQCLTFTGIGLVKNRGQIHKKNTKW